MKAMHTIHCQRHLINYKEVSADAGGNLVFSEVKGQEATKLEGVTAES